MKPEPLKDKLYQVIDIEDEKDRVSVIIERPYVNDGWFDLKDVKSAVEFYLRYKDNPNLFVKEHPKFKGIIDKFHKPLSEEMGLQYGGYWEMEKYNEWLFKKAFEDVMKDE